MALLTQALAAISVLALAGGLAGVGEGWAYAEAQIGGTWGPGAPKVTMNLELGWWNSTTHMSTGFAPIALEASGEAARALGSVTAAVLGLGGLAAVYVLLLGVCDIFRCSVPRQLRTVPSAQYKAAGLFGMLSLILTVVLYLVLMVGAHNKIKEKFDDLNVWPRPDWASGSALLGSFSLLLLAKTMAPDGYEPVGYMPI